MTGITMVKSHKNAVFNLGDLLAPQKWSNHCWGQWGQVFTFFIFFPVPCKWGTLNEYVNYCLLRALERQCTSKGLINNGKHQSCLYSSALEAQLVFLLSISWSLSSIMWVTWVVQRLYFQPLLWKFKIRASLADICQNPPAILISNLKYILICFFCLTL